MRRHDRAGAVALVGVALLAALGCRSSSPAFERKAGDVKHEAASITSMAVLLSGNQAERDAIAARGAKFQADLEELLRGR